MITKVPPSTVEIVELLSTRDLFSVVEIENNLPNYPKQTLRYAIRRLLEYKIIKSVNNLTDMRTVYYRIASESELNGALESLAPTIATKIISAIKFNKTSGEIA